MGDPKRSKKKYSSPPHPWEKGRIESERILKKEYGLKNKKEIMKARSYLKDIRDQSKKLIRDRELVQAQKESKQLLDKLARYGIAEQSASTEGLLDLDIKNILNRRLQSIVYDMKLALTSKQARQMIVHGHICVNGKKVTAPSYVVQTSDIITIKQTSSFANEDHPERQKQIKKTPAKTTIQQESKPEEPKSEEKKEEQEEKKEKPKKEKIKAKKKSGEKE